MSLHDLLRNSVNKQSVTSLRQALNTQPSNPVVQEHSKVNLLDSANEDGEGAPTGSNVDPTLSNIRLQVAAIVNAWVETDDLDDGESLADRLMAMLIGIADADKDGDLTDDEQGVLGVVLEAAWDYLEQLGVPEDDISQLLNDWDEAASDRIRDLVASALPEGDEAADQAIDDFAFSADDQEVIFDATYKKTMVVRKGKKVRINKRVSGRVKLSAKQKMALRKARTKSHSAGAMMRRMKSMKLRRKAGL